MTGLVDQVQAVATSLVRARVPFALGGALALAYATEDPRGTRDIDVNVFVPSSEARRVLSSLPTDVSWSDEDISSIVRDGQVRIWWDQTPLELFFADHEVHDRAGKRVRSVDFAGVTIPVLAPIDLAEQIHDLIGDDSRVDRVRALGQP